MFHTSSNTLAPVNPPVAVYPHMVRNVPVTLTLREKAWSLSGDDFSIKDASNNQSVLKVKGKTMSIHDRKYMYDAQGKMLYNMADKMIAIHKTIVCEGEHGKEILTVKNKWSTGSKLKGAFLDHEDKERTIELRGDMFGTSANITLSDGTNLAHISRKVITVADMAADKQTYHVTVAPGVDPSLIAAVCVCFDEIENEEDK